MSLSNSIVGELPYLRRYARALTGSQASGDKYVRATLEAILANTSQLNDEVPIRISLYRVFHAIWGSVAAIANPEAADRQGVDQEIERRIQALTPLHRQALLLTSVEGFSMDEAGLILDKDDAAIEEMVLGAMAEIANQQTADVLVIEDEPLIRLDICHIVEEMGHQVVAVASTQSEAVEAAQRTKPKLVLADIQLADGSSGIDAVKDILEKIDALIIFVTAFPERLLTGERREPTFLVTKPFVPQSLKVAISQALFIDAAEKN